jgi:hypothetical protein
MDFKLVSDFQPTGDQPEAIRQLVEGLDKGVPFQTLLGVTGSGKTFTVANVIEKVNRPVLVLSHNKTLAAQLYGEFKQFFPENRVEYFVSYYDYYQPEAYLPVTDTYIEKDLAINEEIEKLRLSATSSLLSGRKDIIVVSSVSCIYFEPARISAGISSCESLSTVCIREMNLNSNMAPSGLEAIRWIYFLPMPTLPSEWFISGTRLKRYLRSNHSTGTDSIYLMNILYILQISL